MTTTEIFIFIFKKKKKNRKTEEQGLEEKGLKWLSKEKKEIMGNKEKYYGGKRRTGQSISKRKQNTMTFKSKDCLLQLSHVQVFCM